MCRNYNKELTAEEHNYYEWLEKISEVNKHIVSKAENGLVVETNENITGFLRLIPCRFKIGQQLFDAGFVFDLVSDPGKRGIGIKIMRRIVYSDYLHFGAPGERVETLWAKLAINETDNIVVEKLVRIVCLIDPSIFLERKKIPALVAKLLGHIWKYGLKFRIFLGKYNSLKNVLISKETEFPEDVNQLLETFSLDFYALVKKDKRYLQWRYDESPFEYQKLFIRDSGKLVGYLIYRCGHINSQKVMTIVESIAIGTKTTYYTALLNHLFQEAIENKYHYIQTNLSGCEAFLTALKAKGAIIQKNSNSIISNYPYFKEIDRNEGRKNWFFSVGDSDFEFANFKLE